MKKILRSLFAITIFFLVIGTTYTTIIIDGTNDFESDEDVAGTSSATYYFTWDANYLYLGTQAPDVASGSSTRWVYFYIDSDPQIIPTTGTGTTTGIMYNTQQPGLPFTANYHFRWKTNNTYHNLQDYNGSSWVDGNQTEVTAYQTGQYVEFRIPLANIGSPTQVYIVGAMINEQGGGEWTYHMTPTSNGADGYDKDFTSRFGFNLTTGISPDNPANIDAVLPVELTSFSASIIGSGVKLCWNTSTEINNYGFDVERASLSASPLRVWEKIGFVNGNGNSNSSKSYSYEDKNLSEGKYSYRLKQIDNDGQFEYSKSVEVDFNTPKKFELSQNYPNPFNPATTISFNLPQSGNVKLTLYNLLGQEIRTLINEYKDSGVHTINIDAGDLNTGIYIYKIEVNGLIQTRKMTLLK